MRWIRWLILTFVLLLLGGGVALALYFFGVPGLAFGRPWLLLLLLIIPVVIWYSYKPLRVLGELRCWIVLILRSAIIVLLILALADIKTVKEEESQTVIIVLDRSYSMPQEIDDAAEPGTVVRRDLRWERLSEAMKEATRAKVNRRDKIAVVTFGRRPRLEFPAAEISQLDLKNLTDTPDRSYTDIASAIRLALASFPEGTARRILLISDGNENRGDILKEAKTARLNGVPIDVVPTKYQYENEIVADRIDAPRETLENRDLPIRIILRNYSNRRVSGTLNLWRSAGDRDLKAPLKATLDPGLNVLSLKWPADLGHPVGSFSYRAVFVPDGLPSDRPDNNEVMAPVLVRGEGRRVLLVVPDKEKQDWRELKRAMENAPIKEGPATTKRKLEVDVWIPEQLPGEKEPRLPELSNYDCIFLYNIPADMVPHDKQEALRKNTRDQGCGLVMVGGQDAFGAGRWQGEPLEEALPVDTSIKSLKVQSKGGLVLIMHASEMAMGNYWQKEIGRLAVQKLSSQDEVGVLYYGYPGGHVWHIKLQPVGPNRGTILRDLTTMQPGDMPEFDPSITMAHKSLTDPEKGIGTKHIILVSDGDHGLLQNGALLNLLKKDKITLTTVGVTTHGPAAQQALAAISQPVGGRHYSVSDPAQLPAIYIKETRVINQSFLYEKAFNPLFTSERGDPLREWAKPFPPLHGYVRTQPKDSQLVQVLMRSPVPGEDLNPLLAQWQYGLGRVVAFTSDAGSGEKSWARDWARDPDGMFTEFWGRVMDWSMRNVDEAGLSLQTRFENGKVRISMLDNRDKKTRAERPLASLQVTLTSPGNKDAKTVNLSPVSAGVYEAVVDAEGSGSYAATVSGTLDDSTGAKSKPLILARDAFSVPYSSEFSAVKSNEGLLDQVARETGGRLIDENELARTDIFRHEQAPALNMQPIWFWLVFAAAALMFFDVGIRRIAVDPESVWDRVKDGWSRLRGKAKLSDQSQTYIDRLKSRKAAVGAQLEQPKPTSKKRFEAALDADAPPVTVQPSSGPSPMRPTKPLEKPKLGAEGDKEPEDFATRLMKAKQKAREKMDGEQK